MIYQSPDMLKDFDSVKRQREHVTKDNFFGVENNGSLHPL
jgi:hypothetical protein